jgi:hypothetical protein
MAPMPDQLPNADIQFEVAQLGWRQWTIELITGIAITLGLLILWGLESLRNLYFWLLDRASIKARPRRASPFPPGRPRKLKRRDGYDSPIEGLD